MDSNVTNIKHLNLGGNLILKGLAVVNPKNQNKVMIGTIAPGVIIAPKQPLDEVTLLFPKNVQDGQVMYLSFTQDVAKIIFSGANFANASTIAKAKAGDNLALVYHEKSNKWYKFSGSNN